MHLAPALRGQPLLAFAVMMGSWTVMRVLAWDASDFSPVPQLEAGSRPVSVQTEIPACLSACGSGAVRSVSGQADGGLAKGGGLPHPALAVSGASGSRTAPVSYSAFAFLAGREPDHGLASGMEVAPFHPAGREPAREQRRWSADGWLLLRSGGNMSLATGSAPATYGASQAGTVLRYQLVPHSAHRPAAYLRTTATLNGSREKEAALGLSARPIARLPVVAAVEVRGSDGSGGTNLRPAAFVVTELPPVGLPMGMRGEAYAQAGYVGGRDATAFVDGQLRVDRPVGHLGRTGLRLGGGAWGGAQEGASRLDIGPTAAIDMGLGKAASLRLGIDWRFRVAGNAAPDSGPAITLSAGF